MMSNRILVVDDEPQVGHLLKTLLTKAGYDVQSARNGEEGLSKIADSEPDVLITDIQMPIIGGQELCERTQAEYPKSGRLILVMTSRTDREIRLWAEALPNLELVEKPVSPRRLLARLSEYFGDRADVAGAVA